MGKGISRAHNAQGSNEDLWQHLNKAIQEHRLPSATRVTPTSHLSKSEQARSPFEHYLGNGVADLAADMASERYQERGALLQVADEAEFAVHMVARRLAVIEAACWDLQPNSVPTPNLAEPPATRTATEARQRANEEHICSRETKDAGKT